MVHLKSPFIESSDGEWNTVIPGSTLGMSYHGMEIPNLHNVQAAGAVGNAGEFSVARSGGVVISDHDIMHA